MNELTIDCGLEEYRINGGAVLRFNPADPNLYNRFLELETQLKQLQEELEHKAAIAQDAETVLTALRETDRQLKQYLTQVFGPENDFHVLLQGVNLLSTAGNGESVAVNLLTALEPILERGMERFAGEQVTQAVEKARQRRSSQ